MARVAVRGPPRPRAESERLQQHSYAHLVREVITHKVAALSAQVAVYLGIEACSWMAGTVDVLQDDEAVVAAGHLQSPPQRRNDPGASRTVQIPIFAEKAVEILVVTNFVFGDAAGQACQYRFRAGP